MGNRNYKNKKENNLADKQSEKSHTSYTTLTHRRKLLEDANFTQSHTV